MSLREGKWIMKVNSESESNMNQKSFSQPEKSTRAIAGEGGWGGERGRGGERGGIWRKVKVRIYLSHSRGRWVRRWRGKRWKGEGIGRWQDGRLSPIKQVEQASVLCVVLKMENFNGIICWIYLASKMPIKGTLSGSQKFRKIFQSPF